jgi:hypothetical protein
LSQKKAKNPSVVLKVPAYKQKLNQEFLSRKKGHKYAKKQIRVMGLVPIMLDIHREQVCVKFQSIPFSSYGDTCLHAKT